MGENPIPIDTQPHVGDHNQHHHVKLNPVHRQSTSLLLALNHQTTKQIHTIYLPLFQALNHNTISFSLTQHQQTIKNNHTVNMIKCKTKRSKKKKIQRATIFTNPTSMLLSSTTYLSNHLPKLNHSLKTLPPSNWIRCMWSHHRFPPIASSYSITAPPNSPPRTTGSPTRFSIFLSIVFHVVVYIYGCCRVIENESEKLLLLLFI